VRQTATPRGRFSTTRWSVVLAAAGDSPYAREALATLCTTYWYPLYAFLRRAGRSADEAEDLTQGFFVLLIQRGAIKTADPTRGRFRSFLLASLQHYAINEHHRANALKRGGGAAHDGFAITGAEARFVLEPRDDETPERAYDRRWALTLLDRVLVRCRGEYERAGKGLLFARLSSLQTEGATNQSYADIARELDTSEGAVKGAAHRLRQTFRRMLRDEVAETVSSLEEIDDEMRHLLAAVRPSR
jgi:RNA polymerase sigma factor (sigma-70 family)